jgi:hypothetical protein
MRRLLMRRSLGLAALGFMLLLAPPAFLGATAYDRLELEIWCELEPMIQESDDYPLSAAAARVRVLEEARLLLSAMIYGVRFAYTPSDARRRSAEQFLLTPIAELGWGDPRLRVAETEVRDARLFARVRYDLQDFQSARRRAWQSNAIPTAAGTGHASLFAAAAPDGKRRSLQEAFKEAVRNHLRPILFNKPREVRGELLLWQAPQIIVDAGEYLTSATVKLRVLEIRPYSFF